jgi:hypothetical protein
MWMKAAICHGVVMIFFLFGGLAVHSFQPESYAQSFAEDFEVFDRQDDSMNSSTIRRLRAGNPRLGTPSARTATTSETLFRTVFLNRTTPLPTHSSRQDLHTFDVVLRI